MMVRVLMMIRMRGKLTVVVVVIDKMVLKMMVIR